MHKVLSENQDCHFGGKKSEHENASNFIGNSNSYSIIDHGNGGNGNGNHIGESKTAESILETTTSNSLANPNRPRIYGELPRQMGNFRRIAPSLEYDQIVKMKLSAVKQRHSHDTNFRKQLPNIV
jgi:hypothetical protein